MTDNHKALEWFKFLRSYMHRSEYEGYLDLAIDALKKQEQSCDTCRHGRFGSEACVNCRVGFPSHYEAEEEDE